MERATDDDILGPGTDLAFAFSGMLMVVTILAVVQLWIVSRNVSRIPGLEQELDKVTARSIALGEKNKDLRGKLAAWKDIDGKTRSEYGATQRKLDNKTKELSDAQKKT